MFVRPHFTAMTAWKQSVFGLVVFVATACQDGGTRPTIELPGPEGLYDGGVEDSNFAEDEVDMIADIGSVAVYDSGQEDEEALLDMALRENDVVDVYPDPDVVIDSIELDLVAGDGSVGPYDAQPPCEQPECDQATPILQITAGNDHTCALRESGEISCLGDNWWGALGDGKMQTSSELPTSPIGLPLVKQVNGGKGFTCALDWNGEVWCWGLNQFGAVGNGKFTFGEPTPQKVLKIPKAKSITASGTAAGAVTTDGVAFMWGRNVQGQLGNGDTKDSATPQKVLLATPFIALESGYLFTCGITEIKTVYCWGAASEGQLGYGGVVIGGIPTPVQVVGLSNAKQISSGGAHSCVLLDNGKTACWGMGISGQLGDGTYVTSYTPGTVPKLDNLLDVAVGSNHSCAVSNDGRIHCWGKNDLGQLGDGTTKKSPIPVRAKGIEDAVQVTCGVAHTCALRKNGTVMCWGSNKDGQLGTGTKESSLVPIPAAALN